MQKLWFKNAQFYGLDIRRFQDTNGDGFGDIAGAIQHLDYIKDLGFDAIWLLPFFDSPLRDNGYDIRDYYRVDPRVGTLEEFIQLLEEAHKRELRVVIDLVMNHTSNEHPWFVASRRDPNSRYRDYYVWTETIPEKTLSDEVVFPDVEDSVWAHDPEVGAYYFHRFYHFQPDLRIDNPHVQEEIFKAIDFWLAIGVDGFRIDAAPLMLEPKGIPEAQMEHPHRLLENLHDFAIDRRFGTVLLGEANVPLKEMDEFFGGDTRMNMLFNFQIGPHILLAFARGDALPLYNYILTSVDPPQGDQWLNFLRHHDEVTLDVLPEEQREEIFKVFAPDEDMRIYGRGIRRRLAPMLSEDGQGMNRPKMELAFSFLFATSGTPMVFYGDEIGMGDDLSLPERNAVRSPMQWNGEKNGGFSSADELIAPVISEGAFAYTKVNVEREQANPDSFLHWMKKLIAARKQNPEIGYRHGQVLANDENDQRALAHIFPRAREAHKDSCVVVFHNFSDQPVKISVTLPEDEGTEIKTRVTIQRGCKLRQDGIHLSAELEPYGYLWAQY
jgi:maltose alpha-D-glucosyltransferase / alpha-amylase